jgi:hypothetical protein
MTLRSSRLRDALVDPLLSVVMAADNARDTD